MPGPTFGIITSLLGLLIPIGLVAAIVVLVRRRDTQREETGIGIVRRLYLYGLSFVGLLAAGIGNVLLLKTLLDTLFGPRAIAASDTPLALGLALTIVGTPVWILFWNLAQRSLQQFPTEVTTVSRKLYLYVVLGGSAITSSVAVIMFLKWAFGAGSFSGTHVSLAAVWGGVWAFHWIVEKKDGHSTDVVLSIRRAYVYLMALFGLVVLAIGSGGLLGNALSGAYYGIFGTPELLAGNFSIWNSRTQTTLAMSLVGLGLWWWHWHRVARGDHGGAWHSAPTSRQIYLHLFAILGGATTVIVSLSALLYHLLQWFIGRPATSSALLHFDVLPGLIAAVIVGGGVWGYHRAVVQEEARLVSEKLQAARRTYGYLVAAVGLVTLGIGLVIFLAMVLALAAPNFTTSLARGEWWRNPLVLSITLLIVGAPVWGLHWRDIQRAVASGSLEEQAKLSRRVFIFLIFGLSILLTLVNLSIVLFRLFDAALGQGIHPHLLWDVRWSLAILLTAGAVSVYYWLVLQEDRRATARLQAATQDGTPPLQGPRSRKLVTVLATEQDLLLARQLAERLGYQVQTWRRMGGAPVTLEASDSGIVEVERQIVNSEFDQVFLLRVGHDIYVIPYQVV